MTALHYLLTFKDTCGVCVCMHKVMPQNVGGVGGGGGATNMVLFEMCGCSKYTRFYSKRRSCAFNHCRWVFIGRNSPLWGGC